MNTKGDFGFTLVEMAIVLVIIAIVIGAIIFGQELINVAQTRKVIGQLERYNSAVMAFKNKYNCLPGDCVTAEAAGLSEPGCPVDFYQCSSFGPAIPYSHAGCHGNGDGQISLGGGIGCPEALNFWYHLSRAELIEGNYDGRSLNMTSGFPSAITLPVAGKSAPATSLRDVAVFALVQWYMVGFENSASGLAGHLKHREAYKIDVALDDGNGCTGSILSWDVALAQCPATYNLNIDKPQVYLGMNIVGALSSPNFPN